MKTLFIVINEGFSARILLRTKLLSKLKLNFKIVILSPNSNENYFKKEFEGKNVFFENYEFRKYNKNFIQRFLHNLRLFSFTTKNEFTDYWSEKYIKKKNIITGLIFRILKILYSNFYSFRNFVNYFGHIVSPKKYEKLFKKYKPDFIIVTSLGNLSNDNFIISEAKKNRCKIISFILSWDNTTTKGMYSLEPDYVMVWNKTMFEEINNFHKINVNKIFLIGTLQYEKYLNDEILSKHQIMKIFNLKENQKNILVCLESPTSFRDNKKILKIIQRYLIDHKNVKFIVRPHPLSYRSFNNEYIFKEEIKNYRRFSKQNKNIIFDFPIIESKKLSYDMPKFEEKKLGGLLNYVDLVMCFYSSMALEASIFRKPIINMSFCKRTTIPNSVISKMKHNKRILSYDYVYDANNIGKLYYNIRIALNFPKRKIMNRKKLVSNEISFIKNPSSKAFSIIKELT